MICPCYSTDWKRSPVASLFPASILSQTVSSLGHFPVHLILDPANGILYPCKYDFALHSFRRCLGNVMYLQLKSQLFKYFLIDKISCYYNMGRIHYLLIEKLIYSHYIFMDVTDFREKELQLVRASCTSFYCIYSRLTHGQ